MRETYRKFRGFTLIELMIVVAIVAILMLVAVPSYQDYVRKAKRSMGKAELIEVLTRQEQYFINNRRYADDLTDLGYAANPYAIDDDRNDLAADNAQRIYIISLTTVANGFNLEALPQLGQASDALCGKLTLSYTGIKSADGTGGVDNCW